MGMKMSITGSKLTLNDITILGLLNEEEKGVTGLQLENAIEQRGMRVWTNIGRSSVYYTLNKLQKSRYAMVETLIQQKDKKLPPVKKKFYKITELGRKELEKTVFMVLATHEKIVDPFDVAFAFSGVLTQEKLIDALTKRVVGVQERKIRLEKNINEFNKPNAHGYTLDVSIVSHELVIQHIIALFTRPLAFVEAEEQWLVENLKTIENRR